MRIPFKFAMSDKLLRFVRSSQNIKTAEIQESQNLKNKIQHAHLQTCLYSQKVPTEGKAFSIIRKHGFAVDVNLHFCSCQKQKHIRLPEIQYNLTRKIIIFRHFNRYVITFFTRKNILNKNLILETFLNYVTTFLIQKTPKHI